MKGTYIGVLPELDPLYGFLAQDVLEGALGYGGYQPVFDIYQIHSEATVFGYAERRTRVWLVGKFYGRKWLGEPQGDLAQRRTSLAQREFDNLRRARALGLNSYPHTVVRPLALGPPPDSVLVEEYAFGRNLDSVIWEAVYDNKTAPLYARLEDLAWFLADMHNRSREERPWQPEPDLAYLDKLLAQLEDAGLIAAERRRLLERLRERWAAAGVLGTPCPVLLHGDATPSNFLFHHDHQVTAIDLERMRPGDRALDLGCVAAELKHLFLLYTQNLWSSEPYIRHFYAAYSSYLPAGSPDGTTLTERGRFYMGCYGLRIARNSWLEIEHRRRLIANAEECLEL